MLKIKSNHFKIHILIILIVFMLSGCYGSYEAERAFWLANRKYSRFLKKLETAKDDDYQKLIVEFRKFTISYPSWPKTAQAQLIIGNLYNMQNKQEKAIEEYKKVIEDYPSAFDTCSKALFAVGLIYQAQDNWKEAQKYFKEILEDYPKTEVGLNIPLYIARYYKSTNQTDEAALAYNQALKKYKTFIDGGPNTILGTLVIDYVISCYGDEGRWQDALVYLRSVVDNYPQTPVALKSLFAIGRIYELELKDSQQALGAYRELIEEYPDNPLSKAVKEHLDSQENIDE